MCRTGKVRREEGERQADPRSGTGTRITQAHICRHTHTHKQRDWERLLMHACGSVVSVWKHGNDMRFSRRNESSAIDQRTRKADERASECATDKQQRQTQAETSAEKEGEN